jgi:N6-adenosine-specific RNA methylase IME4
MTVMRLPDIKAGAILADPAIKFATRSVKGAHRSPQHHYQCPTFEELKAIPVAGVASPNCFLFLWMPLHSLFLVEPLMKAWGFKYSGSGFAWAKLNRNGVGWFMGSGYTGRKNVEICFVGRRGWPKRKSGGVRELIVAPVREHSRKPDENQCAHRSLMRRAFLGTVRAAAMAWVDLHRR